MPKINNNEEFEYIYLHRCFAGWEAIRGGYSRPGSDGDIILRIPKEGWRDVQDARYILDHLQGESEPSERQHSPSWILDAAKEIAEYSREEICQGVMLLDDEKIAAIIAKWHGGGQ